MEHINTEDEPSIEAEDCGKCGEAAENLDWASEEHVYKCPSCGGVQ